MPPWQEEADSADYRERRGVETFNAASSVSAEVKRLRLSYGAAYKTTEIAVVTSVRRTSDTSVAFDLGCERSVIIHAGAASLYDGRLREHQRTGQRGSEGNGKHTGLHGETSSG